MEKVKKEFLSLSPASILYLLVLFFLPTQLGRHFWPDFSFMSGIRVDYLSPTFYFTDILIISLFVCWFLSTPLEVKFGYLKPFHLLFSKFLTGSNLKKLKKTKINISLSIVVAFIVLSLGVFLSVSPASGIYGMVKLLEFAFFGFYTAKNIRNLSTVVFVFLLGIVLESFLAIAQFLNQGSVGSLFYFLGERTFNSLTPGIANVSLNGSLVLRPYATFSHPNVLAGYLVLSMSVIFFSSLKRLKYPILSLGTVALLLTLSRAAIIVWVVVVLAGLFKKRWKIAAGVGVMLGIAIYVSPLGGRFILTLVDESVAQRLALVKAAFGMFAQSPILGVGINNFLPNLPFYLKQAGNVFFLQPVHNIFLLILTETGILGIGFSLWFLANTYKRILKRKSVLFFVLISEVLFLGLFDHYFLTLQQGQLLLSFVIGLCWSRASDTIA